MGNLFAKCLECFKPKPKENPVHQLVNLSKNPDTSEGKINPHQISFVDKSSSQDQDLGKQQRDLNDLTLETIPNKQFQGLQSPDSGIRSQQEQEPILQEDCKTNPNEDIATPISAKEGILIINKFEDQQELNQIGIQSLESFEYELLQQEGYEDINNTSKVKLQMKAYQTKSKKYITKLKIEFDINQTLAQYQEWSRGNENNLDQIIENYQLKEVHENIAVVKLTTQKYVCVQPKDFQCLKFSAMKENNYFELYRSFENSDGLRNNDRANVILGGMMISEQGEGKLNFKGFFEVDLSVRLPLAMTRKAYKDKLCMLVDNLRKLNK